MGDAFSPLRLKTRGNRPRARASRSHCQKGNLSYLAIIRPRAIVEEEFQIVAGGRFANQKGVTDENSSFVT